MCRAPRFLCVFLTVALFLTTARGALEAVTFESKTTDGQQSSVTKPDMSGGQTKAGGKTGKSLLYSLDAPREQKKRLAESVELLYLTGLQATAAINDLKALDGKRLPDNEILAKLEYTKDTLEAVEKAAKKLEDNVALVRLACASSPGFQQEILDLLRQFAPASAMASEGEGDTGGDSGSSDSDSGEDSGASEGDSGEDSGSSGSDTGEDSDTSGADADDSGLNFSSTPADNNTTEDTGVSEESDGAEGSFSDGFEGGWSTENSDSTGQDEDTEDTLGDLQDSWSTEDPDHQVMTDEATTDIAADAANDDSYDSDVATIRPGGGFFDSCMDTVFSAAHTIGNAASKVKNEITGGINALVGAVGNVHTTIGSVVGQENWANIMAGTKFVAAAAGSVVALTVAAPATTLGMTGAALVYGITNVSAALTLVKDIQQIEKGDADAEVEDMEGAASTVNQGAALLGCIGSSPGELLVNAIGLSGGQIDAYASKNEVPAEKLHEFLGKPEHQEMLKQNGVLPTYQKPEPQRDEGGGGGGCGG